MNAYQTWVLMTLAMAALPSLLRLPLWVAGVALLGTALRFAGKWRKGWYGRTATALILGGVAWGIWRGFESWFSGDALLSFFIAVVFLKWVESSTRRDYLLLIFAAAILAAVGTLYWENMLNLVHIFLVVFLLTASLVVLHLDPRQATPVFLLKKAGLLFGLGLPVMLLLFVAFPRIPGPLWDLGLAFGLPVKAMMDRGDGCFGTEKSVQPGGISRTNQDNQNVLVAEFEGAVPFKSQLYWRGPVFYEYDGENWNLPENWDDRTDLLQRSIRSQQRWDREVRVKKDPVRYTLRVMPNGNRWLYGLEVPAGSAPESFISDEFQLLSIRRIDDHEPKITMSAFLTYSAGEKLSEEQRRRSTAWPEGTNPRLLALGREFRRDSATVEDILLKVYALLRGGDYVFDAGYLLPAGEHQLDRFFFDEKKGGAEYLTGSVVMLLRAAGVPARLVGGFRGGTIIALTKFVVVKRSDAHVWAEAWDEDKGWVRVEAKDIMAPPDKKVEETTVETQTSEVKVERKNDERAEEDAPQAKPVAVQEKPAAPPTSGGMDWSLPQWSSLLGDMQKWIIRYDPHRQMDVLKGLGKKDGDWLDLLLVALVGVVALFLLYLLFAWWRLRARLDRVAISWRGFCRRLEKLGLEKSGRDCPRDFLVRVVHQRPELATAAEDIISRYIAIRYGQGQSPEAEILFSRQVQRFLSMT